MSNPEKLPTLAVVARAPFHVYFDGPALGVTAKNSVGTFDILPGHADFFSVLVPCTVTISTEKETLSFDIDSGILTVRDEHVHVFVNM